MMHKTILLSSLLVAVVPCARGWQGHWVNWGRHSLHDIGRRRMELHSTPQESDDSPGSSSSEEYRNPLTAALSNFLPNEETRTAIESTNVLASIDFQAPKIAPTTSLETLAQALDYELTEKEWFVTGNVNPSFFSDEFKFEDPQVKVAGIEDYSKGVSKIFDRSTARAEIISTLVNEELSKPDRPVITCKWRLSGGVNLGRGLQIKPYLIDTDFGIDPETSLIAFQEDRFSLPSWDILLSSLFPFLIGKVTKPPAPPVPKRKLTMPKLKYIGSATETDNNFRLEGFSELLQNLFPKRQ